MASRKFEDAVSREAFWRRHVAGWRLCGWALAAAQKLEPMVQWMKDRVLASHVIHTDDTPVHVRGKDGPFTGRFWTYVGDAANPYTVYDYTPSRNRDGPAAFLDGYQGYLQADAFGGYDGIYASGAVLEVACWAHTRRKFYEARSTDPDRAHRMLAWIRRLYDIEREAKKLDAEGRRALRQERARPILHGTQGMEAWLLEQQPALLPKSPIGNAVNYALGNWTALTRYLDDGALAIDNNPAEQSLRGIAVGRNYAESWIMRCYLGAKMEGGSMMFGR